MRWVRYGLVALLALAPASLLFTHVPAAEAKSAAAKTPEEMAKQALAKWKTTLKITDAQAPQFEQVMTDSYRKMAEAKTAAAGDKTKLKASMQDIMKDRDEALAKVLTPEQMDIYHKKVEKMASEAHKKMAKAEATTK